MYKCINVQGLEYQFIVKLIYKYLFSDKAFVVEKRDCILRKIVHTSVSVTSLFTNCINYCVINQRDFIIIMGFVNKCVI